MYINLNEDDNNEHIGYVICRPDMADTVTNIQLALEEHFDADVKLPATLREDLLERFHNLHQFDIKIADYIYQISATDGWVY